MDVRGDVELGSHLGVLAVAHEASVDIEVHVGSDRAEVGYHLLAVPVGRDGDDAAV